MKPSGSWTIAEWDAVKARGAIVRASLGRLPFDAAAALVDDIGVGEAVHVELRPDGPSYRVTRIWPDDPRVRVPDGAPAVPPLSAERATAVERTLSSLPVCIDYRVASLGEDLVIEGDDALFEFGAAQRIVFAGVEYVECPVRWDGKAILLATPEERRYLGSKLDLSAESVVVIVDEALHPFFVACADISFAPRMHR